MPRVSNTGEVGLQEGKDGLLRIDYRFWNKKLKKRDRYRHTFRDPKTTLTKARKRLQQIKREIDDGTFEPHPGKAPEQERTIKEVLQGYLQLCEEEGQKAVKSKGSVIDVLSTHLGSVPASQLCAADLQKFRKQRLKKVTGCTVNRGLTVIKHAARLGCARGDQTGVGPWGSPWMDGERLAQIQGVRQCPKNPRRVRRPEGDEMPRLFEALTPPMVPIVKAAIYTGLREENLARLKKSEVDLKRRVLRIGMTKNGNPHEVSISDGLTVVLQSSMTGAWVRRGKRVVHLLNTTEYVFIHHQRKPYTPGGVSKAFGRAKKKAGFDPATGRRSLHFHDLRREFGSQLAENGFSLEHIRKALGHADLSTTQRYISITAEETREAVASVRIPGEEDPTGSD